MGLFRVGDFLPQDFFSHHRYPNPNLNPNLTNPHPNPDPSMTVNSLQIRGREVKCREVNFPVPDFANLFNVEC